MSPALRRTWNVVRKEWEVLSGTWNGVLLATLMPALVVAQALVVIWAISHFAGETLAATEVLRTALAKMAGSLPGTGGLPVQEQLQVLFLYQFNFYLLLVPCIVAISLATFSIVEEKQARTLEPLLAHPRQGLGAASGEGPIGRGPGPAGRLGLGGHGAAGGHAAGLGAPDTVRGHA